MSDPKQTQAGDGSVPAKPRRRFRILLGVSLALNLLVLGAVVGAIAKGPRSHGTPPGLREISAPYVGAFDRETKRDMRQSMRARLPDRSSAIKANKADYARFVALVRADTFDAASASEIMEGQLARAGNVQKLGREMAIERISAMSREDRMAYAERLEGWLEHKKERRSKKER
ncbi:MAG: periplasmic heavy metal sensor [Planktotalea sp.]|uniref:periplasmic heavy metal sensor n=1 Tax=Planktotalea sp. TaxID=2029877 RepID=UPI003C736C28